jgi:hypothetical protein
MTRKKMAPRRGKAANDEIFNKSKLNDNSSSAQRNRILQALREGPVNTLKARSELNCLHPAARIQELRNQGYYIITNWRVDTTSEGFKHRVAEYVLFTSKQRKGAA